MSQDIWVVVETLRNEVLEISYTMLVAGRELADGLGGDLRALILGHQTEELAGSLGVADHITYVDHPCLADFTSDAYQRTIAGVLKEAPPRIVLFGHTSMGMDVACSVGLQLDVPLITSCQTVKFEDDTPQYIALTCGGKVVAEGPIPGPTCLITMVPGGYKSEAAHIALQDTSKITRIDPPAALDDLRVNLRGYIEPETGDVDLTKESILVSVGRGIQQQDNLKLAEDLATALNGSVSASRPIVDQGWLPTSRMIGKSGRQVKPRLYLALGISGAPEHLEGVPDFETMVAINTDEQAPIFDFAQYGAAVDVLDLMPVLTEKIKRAKGG
jgi:electron transfer flavoprotein alpha subunit